MSTDKFEKGDRVMAMAWGQPLPATVHHVGLACVYVIYDFELHRIKTVFMRDCRHMTDLERIVDVVQSR